MLELKHFRLLDALVTHGTMTAAARALGYSQPAITQQLRLLERGLGTPLIVRSRTGTRLTEAGEILHRRGRPILETAALAASEVAAIAGLRAGRVRLASFPSAAATVLPAAFAAMGEAHPGISFVLAEAERRSALELLRRGDCDIAIVSEYSSGSGAEDAESEPEPGEKWVTLIEEELRIAVPPTHPLARTETAVDLAAAAEERWIAGCAECRGNLRALCADAGFEPEVAFETDDYVAIQSLVAAGLGVAILSDLMLVAGRADRAFALRALAPRSTRVVRAVVTMPMLEVPAVAQTLSALVTAARGLQGRAATVTNGAMTA